MLPALPLVVFIIAVFTVVLSVLYQDEIITIPILNCKYRVQFYYPPLIGVCFLLLLHPTTGSIDGLDIWIGGFYGEGKVFPYKTMIQFETLAFVCIALDMTGVLAYIALKGIQAAGSSGRKLYFYFFALSSAFTICTSNDIVILTLTPIIYYCTKVAKVDPLPMLFSEFFTANICSMVLVIGNPVNLIVADANGLSFTAYSNWMAAPAIVGAFCCCMGMYLWYRKDIDVTFTPPTLNPATCLKDKRGMIFHGVVLFLTRVFLGLGGKFNWEAWIITSIAAACSLIYNLVFWPWTLPISTQSMDYQKAIELNRDILSDNTSNSYSDSINLKPLSPSVNGHHSTNGVVSETITEKEFLSGSNTQNATTFAVIDLQDGSGFNFNKTTKIEVVQDAISKLNERDPDEVAVEIPTVRASIVNCPWTVLPFVFGMFTLVHALKNAGWIEAFANSIIDVIPRDEGDSARAIAISTFLMCTISFTLCTLIANQPASILLTEVLLAPAFDQLPKMVRTAGMLGVLEGANVGGCWSLMGALAGIMWATLLRNKGITIGYVQFIRVGLKIIPFVTFMVALIIFFETYSKA